MRRQKHVVELPQVTVLGQRFLLKHIKNGASDNFRLKSFDKVDLAACGPAPDVHKHPCWLHFLEKARIEKMVGLRSFRQNAYNIVTER